MVQDLSVLLVRILGEAITVEARGSEGIYPARRCLLKGPPFLNYSTPVTPCRTAASLMIEYGNAYLDRRWTPVTT